MSMKVLNGGKVWDEDQNGECHVCDKEDEDGSPMLMCSFCNVGIHNSEECLGSLDGGTALAPERVGVPGMALVGPLASGCGPRADDVGGGGGCDAPLALLGRVAESSVRLFSRMRGV